MENNTNFQVIKDEDGWLKFMAEKQPNLGSDFPKDARLAFLKLKFSGPERYPFMVKVSNDGKQCVFVYEDEIEEMWKRMDIIHHKIKVASEGIDKKKEKNG